MDTYYNRVFNEHTKETLYETTNLDDACEWMMSRVEQFKQFKPSEVGAEEVCRNCGLSTGWWSIEDLLEENGNKWELNNGDIVHMNKDRKIWIECKKEERKMEKITYTYSHDCANDTTIELVKCPGRTQIEIDFEMEDPNVGLEIAVYGTDDDVDFITLAQEWLDEINAYLDGDKTEADVYDDYTSNMWYCIANSLDWLINEKMDIRNGKYMTIADAAKLVANRLWKDKTKTFAFCESDREEAKQGPAKHEDNGGWHGIKRINGDFDNEPDEFIIAVGHYGGGNVGFGYTDQESTDYERTTAVRRAICEATGWDSDNLIYIEEDKKEEK